MKAEERFQQLQEELKEARETIRDLSKALRNVTTFRCNCRSITVQSTEIPKIKAESAVNTSSEAPECIKEDVITDETQEEAEFDGSRNDLIGNVGKQAVLENLDGAENESKEVVRDAEEFKEEVEMSCEIEVIQDGAPGEEGKLISESGDTKEEEEESKEEIRDAEEDKEEEDLGGKVKEELADTAYQVENPISESGEISDVRESKEDVRDAEERIENTTEDLPIEGGLEESLTESASLARNVAHIMNSVDEIKELIKIKSDDIKAEEGKMTAIEEIAEIMKEKRDLKRKEDGFMMSKLKPVLEQGKSEWIMDRISIYHGRVFIDDGRNYSFDKFITLVGYGAWTLFPEKFEVMCCCVNFCPSEKYFPLEGSLETGFRARCIHTEHKDYVHPKPSIEGFRWMQIAHCKHFEIMHANVGKVQCSICADPVGLSQCKESPFKYVIARMKESHA